jgi:hypothetical protein
MICIMANLHQIDQKTTLTSSREDLSCSFSIMSLEISSAFDCQKNQCQNSLQDALNIATLLLLGYIRGRYHTCIVIIEKAGIVVSCHNTLRLPTLLGKMIEQQFHQEVPSLENIRFEKSTQGSPDQ